MVLFPDGVSWSCFTLYCIGRSETKLGVNTVSGKTSGFRRIICTSTSSYCRSRGGILHPSFGLSFRTLKFSPSTSRIFLPVVAHSYIPVKFQRSVKTSVQRMKLVAAESRKAK
jgi:hypothetical protein